MNLLNPPQDAHHIAVSDGEAFIWQPRADIVVQRAAGVLSLPLAQLFGEFYVPILKPRAHLRVFDDFEGVTDYTREAREFLTTLSREHLFAIDAIHFLLSSKYMALGVSAFKHDIGDELVRVYSDRGSILRSLSDAMASVVRTGRA